MAGFRVELLTLAGETAVQQDLDAIEYAFERLFRITAWRNELGSVCVRRVEDEIVLFDPKTAGRLTVSDDICREKLLEAIGLAERLEFHLSSFVAFVERSS